MLQKLGFSTSIVSQRDITPLDAILPAAVFEVDSTLLASYPGSGQTWYNLVTTPSGGSPRTAYDFTVGTTTSPHTDDPTFMGAAGDAAAYWTFDGADTFRAIASVSEFAAHMCKTTTGPDFTVVAAFRFQDSALEQRIFATQNHQTIARGLSVGLDSDKKLYLNQYGETAQSLIVHDHVLTVGADYLCIVACEKATNKVRFWLNTRTGTELGFTMNPCNIESYGYTSIGARSIGTADFLTSGTRLYHVSLLNGAIGDTDAAKIFNHLNARHGRVYG